MRLSLPPLRNCCLSLHTGRTLRRSCKLFRSGSSFSTACWSRRSPPSCSCLPALLPRMPFHVYPSPVLAPFFLSTLQPCWGPPQAPLTPPSYFCAFLGLP